MTLDELIALGEKATPGPWKYETRKARGGPITGYIASNELNVLRTSDILTLRDRDYIAALSPSELLPLLTLLKDLLEKE